MANGYISVDGFSLTVERKWWVS